MVVPLSDNRSSRSTVPVRLILASESPRRAELLREHGYQFDVVRPPLPEPSALAGCHCPSELAESLSFFKARSVAADVITGVILAADTVSALNAQIFGKPRDRADAARILRTLMGTTHQVITGITVLDAATQKRVIAHDVTNVSMRAMTNAELEAYLNTNAWVGKAGAYGIQDHGDCFVTQYDGSFSNVVGLPMEMAGPFLSAFGVLPQLNASNPPAT